MFRPVNQCWGRIGLVAVQVQQQRVGAVVAPQTPQAQLEPCPEGACGGAGDADAGGEGGG